MNPKLKFYNFIQSKFIRIPINDKFDDLPAKVEFETAAKKVIMLAFYTVSVDTDNLIAMRLKSD
jgi:hypothetical protein